MQASLRAPAPPSRSLRGRRAVVWVVWAIAVSSVMVILHPGPRSSDASGAAVGFDPSLTTSINRTVGWSNVTSILGDDDHAPHPTAMSGAAFDPTESAAVFFGGVGSANVVENATWLFVGGEDEWLGVGTIPGLGNNSGPPPLEHAGEAYDAQDGYLFMYGGTLADGSAYGGAWGFGGNTWENLSWTNLTSTMARTPGPVAWPMMTYDTVDGAVFLYTGAAQNSTWEYRHGVWESVGGPTSPPPRTDGALAYDEADDEVVLFGGSSAGPSPTPLDDTWTFSNGNWTQLDPAVSPPALPWVAAAYDGVSNSVALVGGGNSVQTWMFENGSWSNQTSQGPNIPTGLTGFAVAYQPLDGWLMLFGGDLWGTTPAVPSNTIWGWDFPPQPSYSGLNASPLSTDTWIAIVLVATVPVIGAILWTRWPRRPTPSDVTLPTRQANARAEGSGSGNS